MVRSSVGVIDTGQFRAAMRQKGLDITRLAESAQISRQFASFLAAGERRCRPEVARRIAEVLEQPVEGLFGTVMSESSDNKEPVMPVQVDDPYIYIEDVAELVGMELATLRYYRAMGKGPEFFAMVKGGRLRIQRSKALAWIKKYENGEIEGPRRSLP